MPGRLGPRFALETLFLIALAVAAAFADLEPKWIAAIMAGGWAVVALLEWTSERIWATAPPWRRPYYSVPPPVEAPAPPSEVAAEPEPEPVYEPVAAPEPEPEPEPETMIVSQVEPEPEPEPAGEAPEPEPLQPRAKRRWFRRSVEEGPEAEPPPPPPKHVRLLPISPHDGEFEPERKEQTP